MDTKRYDALVIGSGPAGSFAAKELSECGLEVLLLEAGRAITEADFNSLPEGPQHKAIDVFPRVKAAILHRQPIQARVAFFGEQFSPFFVNDLQNPYTTPAHEFYLWIRGRQLGGRLHTYGRMLLRMTDYDFKAASHDGFGDDWPIGYEELAPWYDHVERFMGVYGQKNGIRNLPDGRYCGQAKLTAAEKALKDRVEALWPDRAVIPWRYGAPNLKRVPLGILAAQQTGRLTLRTNAVVRRLLIDDSTGKATGAEYIDSRTKKSFQASANLVVLCASTIESIRILLNSGSAKHPDGAGNSSGLLGHYFMDQGSSLTFGSVPAFRGCETDDSAPLDPFYPPSGGFYIPRFQNLDSITHPAFKRGFAFQGTVGRAFAPDASPSVFGMMGFAETLPSYRNMIKLHPRRKDAWGIPIPHIRCVLGDNEHAMIAEMMKTARATVEATGYQINFSGSPYGLENEKSAFPDADWISRFIFRKSFKRSLAVGAAIHECGGARMGSDPARSVLNQFNQCWDIKNLFVTDGASFVSSGTVGPALTIMALTARACDYAARQYKDGKL